MRASSLRRTKPLVKSMAIYFFIVGLLFAGIGSKFFNDANNVVAPAFNRLTEEYTGDSEKPISESFARFTWKDLLFSSIPGLKEISGIKPPSSWDPANLFLYLLTGEKIDDPLYCLKTEVPVLNMVPLEMDSKDELEPDPITEPPEEEQAAEMPKIENQISSDLPLVAFYCTHSSETYELTAGVTHLKGKAGAIMDVAKSISENIQNKYLIPTIYIDKIHDTSFNKSYVESQKTVIELLENSKSVKMLFDIHRDSSLPRERTYLTIKGKNYAKVLIVVGTDARASHPKWRENMAFARKLAAKMDELYPGLSRGVSVKNGRYNQQHHTSALLLEVGSVNNYKEEALNTSSLLADVIVDLLNEENSPTIEKP